MKVSILCVTYDHDLKFIKYQAHSIINFCANYHSVVYVIDHGNLSQNTDTLDPETENTKCREYLQSYGCITTEFPKANKILNGYNRQQYIKLHADLILPEDTDYVMFVDSDFLFFVKHTPDYFLKEGKPNIYMTKYEYFLKRLEINNRINACKTISLRRTWIEKLLGFSVEHSYMRTVPSIYPINVFKPLRDHIYNGTNTNFLNHFLNNSTVSEFELLGAFCHKIMNNDVNFVETEKIADCQTEEYKNHLTSQVVTHFWSNNEIDDTFCSNVLSLNIDQSEIGGKLYTETLRNIMEYKKLQFSI